jgi:hypothetical protein
MSTLFVKITRFPTGMVKIDPSTPADQMKTAGLHWKRSGEASQATLSTLHRLKRERHAEARQQEWTRITTLIKNKRFSTSESTLSKWKASGDAPSNLDEL